ncbi:hypothetical protein AVEN_274854-1 [Araneus ventricosus]|uniref:Uncharacterized protein n=1 Tax=Araneus ventricosus TaxID=182803 RepID=A0A4Y2IB09_ARAVE|nr:hypothetical protein AVEN_274854-1 [Araneus ventricosus]
MEFIDSSNLSPLAMIPRALAMPTPPIYNTACAKWRIIHPDDSSNLAKKRLEVTTEKLFSHNLYEKYENVFQEWLDEGTIGEVPPNEVALCGNYLPHRPVIKESSSTTRIRPVFDT